MAADGLHLGLPFAPRAPGLSGFAQRSALYGLCFFLSKEHTHKSQACGYRVLLLTFAFFQFKPVPT
jgi:hypothetical protein